MAIRTCFVLVGMWLLGIVASAEEAKVKALALIAAKSDESILIAEVESTAGSVRVEVVPLAGNAGGAVQAIVARQANPRVPTVAVREEVDREDPVERFVLFTHGGPFVIQTSITLDGKPFRVAREELIDEIMAAADKDKNMKLTWEEAIGSPLFSFGRFRVANDQQRQSYIKAFDTNQNGEVDRAEARRFVAQYFQGPAFTLTNGYSYGAGNVVVRSGGGYYYQNGAQTDVVKLLDTDNDGELTEKEIAAASQRLKSRDADDNDLLYANELTENSAADNRARRVRTVQRGYRPQLNQLTVLLGPTADAKSLFEVIQAKYKDKEGHVTAKSFRAIPSLFKQLDKNESGELEQDEVLALNDVKPHLELAVNLGKSENKGIKILSIAEQLNNTKDTAESISAELPGIKLSVIANLNAARTYNYASTATRYLQQYDKDGNEYLDMKELPANFARQFEVWDADSDGKVYAKEIASSYDRQQAPMRTQVRASAASQGNSLFQALDVSGDGRLSLREMRTAEERIKNFDKNKDGRIAGQEIPVTYTVTIGQGNTAYGYRTVRTNQGGSRVTNQPAKSDNPEWFTRMDRNGDGDVTLKEFLGGEDDFKQLDTNNDGFIEPAEAKSAETGSKSE